MAITPRGIENTLRTIFRRCVQCPPGTPPCPACASDETCSLNTQTCAACASTVCIKIGSVPGQTAPPSTPIGAIIGGVVGGVVFVIVCVFVLWKIKKQKQEDRHSWIDQVAEKRGDGLPNRSTRQSVRSAHSIASTVLTRASNVIQIAYIPGVQNRSPPDSPGLLVPPVPALPSSATNTTTSTPHFEQDQHFFMPGDLRDSAYSGFSEMDRSSIAPSLARMSVATTHPMSAQQALHVRAGTVRVHGAAPRPAVPQVPVALAQSTSSIVARNLTPRPIHVKRGNPGKVPTLANLRAASSDSSLSSTKYQDASSSLTTEADGDAARPSPEAASIVEDAPVSSSAKSKSSDAGESSGARSMLPAGTGLPPDVTKEIEQRGPAQKRSTVNSTDSGGITTMIEEAMNRAARGVPHVGIDVPSQQDKHDAGPFSDANEVKENL